MRRKRRSADNREFYQEALKEQEKYKNMKEELKKRYRCRYITEALISIVIGIFIMGTQYGNIKIWMKPAINLEDLRAEDIRQNNIKVKGVITDVAGEYEYWTGGDASFAHMEKEFVILVNGSYIALIPPYGDWEDRFYNNMNLTKEYSDGDKEAKERMESIEVEGTIKNSSSVFSGRVLIRSFKNARKASHSSSGMKSSTAFTDFLSWSAAAAAPLTWKTGMPDIP